MLRVYNICQLIQAESVHLNITNIAGIGFNFRRLLPTIRVFSDVGVIVDADSSSASKQMPSIDLVCLGKLVWNCLVLREMALLPLLALLKLLLRRAPILLAATSKGLAVKGNELGGTLATDEEL
ncbi:hypothetical protein GQX74_013084 [Glossina fuscipes]|nr:hypothetical protein GQX74_013084 [Glossina fuscipes]